ncbi:MAG: cyclic pyranopterin phosphate synthase [Deltaproteobacteria bacterium RIFCSPLOWO2_12_FULL_57_22]|nr:MAG: cyclic pyranopterin phosphate synthase [Deltaproteobacteria bacterium RIFCSPLOWO2_12_FULL_57_22]
MLVDGYKRPIKDLRISVTDRCNFRCVYCMPHDEYEWIDKKEILTFEEITRLARLFARLGVDKIRLTGGEPLMRRNLELLIAQLSSIEGIKDICVTTNGSLLADKVAAFKAAGLKRINVSVDTLKPEKFKEICKRGDLDKVLEGLFAAQKQGLHPIKVNAVIERGVNDDDIVELVEFSRQHGFFMRFIEYMDVGNTNSWTSEKLVSKKEIVEKINARFPLKEVGRENGSAPAVDYEFVDGRGEVGIVASVTEPFCSTCNRARLTADGKLVTCLFSSVGHDLKALLRGGSSDEEILNFITGIWQVRKDRYSSERLEALQSSTYDPKQRKKIEMITLGG